MGSSMGSSSPRWRRALGGILAVLAAVLLSCGTVAIWAIDTFFDTDAFSDRAVQVLDSEAARRELAIQLTDQLAQRGNREVIAVRPAAQLTIEAVIDTDTFRSIFATAVKRLHADLIAGSPTSGLDLSDSLALLSSSLQLSQGQAANPGDTPNSSVISDALDRVGRLPVWDHRDGFQSAALVMVPLGILAAAASVIVATDRRRALRRVGFALIGAGAGLFAAVIAATLATAKFASDDNLEAGLRAAAWSISVDLRTAALGIAAVGIVFLAASDREERLGPRHLADRLTGWVDRMRTSTGRTLVLAAIAAIAGVAILSIEPATLARAVTAGVGLTLLYAAVRLVVGVLPTSAPPGATAEHTHRGWWVAASAVCVMAVAGATVLSIDRGHTRAAAAVERTCLGSAQRCDLRLDEITLAGAHNAMSSVEYPGWLFAEQIEPIGAQLRSGVRALLIDTHYGVQSDIAIPGSESALVVTDRAAELVVPGAEQADPELVQRAEELAARAPIAASESRGVYLCHNFCELGAVPLLGELRTLHDFLDEHPSEIVVVIIQDATSSDDVLEIFDQAGLLGEVATLEPGQPLPTIGELVDDGTQLIVFAERGDDDAPPWLHRADDWFQETGFTFESVADLDCEPNRGDSSRPLMLVNHWVSRSPPDPAVARAANDDLVVRQRVEACTAADRPRPNVIAADFVTDGDVVAVANSLTPP
jgi:hypothetical protein